MRNRLLLATAITYAAIGATTSYSAAPSAQEFVTKVSVSDKFEVESSKLAISKASDKNVKDFADRMVQDHTKTTQELKDALKKSKSGATPATKLDDEHQAKYDKLKGLSGKEFDANYVDIQQDAHEQAVSLFDDYAKNGEDAALKEFAGKTLPALKIHLDHAKKLEK